MSDEPVPKRPESELARERGHGLKAIREAFDLSVVDVANAMQRFPSYVSAIERGRHDKYDIQAYVWACVRLWQKESSDV